MFTESKRYIYTHNGKVNVSVSKYKTDESFLDHVPHAEKYRSCADKDVSDVVREMKASL